MTNKVDLIKFRLATVLCLCFTLPTLTCHFGFTNKQTASTKVAAKRENHKIIRIYAVLNRLSAS